MANKNRSISTYLTIFSLERMDEICYHSSVFLIRPIPTHENSLGVDLKISIFWFAHPNRRHELQKKREYGDRSSEMESASFTPLVFSTTGGMGREGLTFYHRLVELLSRHDATTYSGTLSFSLLRSATMCIRGSRSISFRQSDASSDLGPVRSTVDRNLQLFQSTDSVSKRSYPKEAAFKVINPACAMFILNLVTSNPAIYLHEIQAAVEDLISSY